MLDNIRKFIMKVQNDISRMSFFFNNDSPAVPKTRVIQIIKFYMYYMTSKVLFHLAN